jgi:hypothetical protein
LEPSQKWELVGIIIIIISGGQIIKKKTPLRKHQPKGGSYNSSISFKIPSQAVLGLDPGIGTWGPCSPKLGLSLWLLKIASEPGP